MADSTVLGVLMSADIVASADAKTDQQITKSEFPEMSCRLQRPAISLALFSATRRLTNGMSNSESQCNKHDLKKS